MHTQPNATKKGEQHPRNVVHLWTDKRILRFFRHNFNGSHYKNLRSVYLALCEIDSDFGEGVQIKGFTKTVATYAGLYVDTIRSYLQALKEAGIANYEQENEGEGFGATKLVLYEWVEDEADSLLNKILSVLSLDEKENQLHNNNRRSS